MLKQRTLQMPISFCHLAFYYILIMKGTSDRLESRDGRRNFCISACLLQSISVPEFQQFITAFSFLWHTQSQPPRAHQVPGVVRSEHTDQPELQLRCPQAEGESCFTKLTILGITKAQKVRSSLYLCKLCLFSLFIYLVRFLFC